jgi:hypothetical protein
MKKHKTPQRTLVLRKETLQVLSSSRLALVAGGAPWSEKPEAGGCPFTPKTCASLEFAC